MEKVKQRLAEIANYVDKVSLSENPGLVRWAGMFLSFKQAPEHRWIGMEEVMMDR